MADGRLKVEWDQTSNVIATLININRPPKSKPVTAESINPFAERKRPTVIPADISALKVFLR